MRAKAYNQELLNTLSRIRRDLFGAENLAKMIAANLTPGDETAEDVEQQEQDIGWTEYQFFVALANLREVAPTHFAVTTMDMALQSRPGLARRQAD